MKQLIFDCYVPFASAVVAGGLVWLILGMLFGVREAKIKKTGMAILAYLSVVALGMSKDIKHLSTLGFIHSFIAFGIAYISIKHLRTQITALLLIPCGCICVVVVFNMLSHDIGLELFGRWIQAP